VRLLKSILTLLLAVAWVPLTAHCQIEKLTGLELLSCSCPAADTSCDDSHSDGACCGWESGQYQLPQGQPTVAAPLVAVVPMVMLAVEVRLPAKPASPVESAPLPRPPKPWQFSLRAALPVRAPSVTS
jgi:hypothetical protein